VAATQGQSRATADQHAAAALAAGVPKGLASVGGNQRVLGRPCTEVRTGTPIGQPLSKPTKSDHADLCVDRTGIVLSERWTRGGKLVRTRKATAFNIDPYFDDATFRPEPAADPALAKASLSAVAHPASESELAALGFTFTPPAGYTSTGPMTTKVSSSSNNLPAITEYSQFFRHGSDVIELQQGSKPEPPSGTAVSVPGLGRAFLTLDMTASSIEAVDASGRYARLEGADVSRLISAATGLRGASSG
jgi:hypothetical protein